MKNVEGWEVGKWRGEPVYFNLADRYPVIAKEHYYMHADKKYMKNRMLHKWYH